MNCYSCKSPLPEDATTCPTCGLPQGFDQKTIDAAIKGDQTALTELYNKTYGSVYNTIKFLVRDEDAALDILQDSYVKAFRSLDMLQDPSRFGAWIRRIAHNRAIDWLRQSRPVSFESMTTEDSGDEIELVDDRPDNLPEVVIDQQETARLLRQILDSLPDDQRVCVTLYYYDQLSVQEIADELCVPEATVKSRLFYGRKKIESQVKSLERRGVKLYGIAPAALIMWLFRNQQAQAAELCSTCALRTILARVASGVDVPTGGTASTATATTGGATASATGAATQAASTGIGAKIIAAAVAVALVGVGGAAVARRFSARQTASPEVQQQFATEEALPAPEEPPVTPEMPLPEDLTTDSTYDWGSAYDDVLERYLDRLCAVPSAFLESYDAGLDHGYSDGVNNELIAELFRYGSQLWYGNVDFNGDGIEELVLGTKGDGWTQCWDIYTFNGIEAVPLFVGDNALAYRQNLFVLPDGTLDLHGSGGVDAGTDTFFRIAQGGLGLEPAEGTPDISQAVDALSWGGVQLHELAYEPGGIADVSIPAEETVTLDIPNTEGVREAYADILRQYQDSMNADPANDPLYGTYDWVQSWVDSRGEQCSVQHAEYDLNGDGVLEMIIAAYVYYGAEWQEWYPFEIYTYGGKNAIALFVGQITTADWLHFATDGTMWITQGNADSTPVRRWRLDAGAIELTEIASAGSEDEAADPNYTSILQPVQL